MSKADWTFLELLLEQGQEYSTGVGQVWLTVLFLFRVLVLTTAAESVWGDEQSDFVCNTLQPGCETVCYDKAFPISHFRFFIMQVIAVAAPAIFYLSYATLHASWERKREEHKEEEEESRKSEEKEGEKNEKKNGKGREREGAGQGVERASRKKPRLRGRLLHVYLSVSMLKLLLEVAFILILWRLYGFTVPAHYVCQRWPCPHTVDCFVSRPKEKTVFTVYMQAMAGVSLLFNLLEVCALLRRCCCVAPGNGLPAPTPIPTPLPLPLPLLSDSTHLHLPAENGRAAPRWDAGIGSWGGRYALRAEPGLFAPPPSVPHPLGGGARAAGVHSGIIPRATSRAVPCCERQNGGAFL